MSESPDTPLETSDLEQRLKTLTANPCELDRDRLMFLAGQTSAAPSRSDVTRNRPVRFWQCSTAVSTVACLVLITVLLQQSTNAIQEPTSLASDPKNNDAPSTSASPITPERSPEPQLVDQESNSAPLAEVDASYLALRQTWLHEQAFSSPDQPPLKVELASSTRNRNETPISLRSLRPGMQFSIQDPAQPIRTNPLIDSILGDTL